MRAVFVGCLVVACGLMSTERSVAQSTATAVLTDWPADSPANLDDAYPFDLLPFLDTLAVTYQYAVIADTPRLAFTLSWVPSAHAIYRERAVGYRDLPGEIVLEALEVSAAVVVDGQPIGTLILAQDSLDLAPAPSASTLTWTDVAWDAVFLDASPETARTAFESGFTLTDLTIEQIAFSSHERIPERRVTVSRRQPVYTNIVIDLTFWDFWRTSGRAHYPPPRRPKADTPRGEEMGRGATASPDRSRSSTRSGARSIPAKTKNDDDEDEDEDSLVPAALVAVAAVGLVGAAGGTIGFYGTSETPIGLAAGFTRPHGGGLLMAGINEAVLRSGSGQKLTAKVLGFYDFLGAPVQPAISAGVLAQTQGSTTDIEPSIAFGGILNVGPALVHLGYDPLRTGIEFGAAVNFRHFTKK